MVKPITFAPLLEHLSNSPDGAHLAKLSVQTKVEKFVLAEAARAAEARLPQLEFWLEEPPRRDLTVRDGSGPLAGPLVEWVEAKMCYSDCVARALTRRKRVEEYRQLVAQDVAKQRAAHLDDADRNATLTTALFMFHRTAPHARHTYYPGFKNRRSLAQDEVRQEVIRYCTEDIPQTSARIVAEHFNVLLDPVTELLCFFYRDATRITSP